MLERVRYPFWKRKIKLNVKSIFLNCSIKIFSFRLSSVISVFLFFLHVDVRFEIFFTVYSQFVSLSLFIVFYYHNNSRRRRLEIHSGRLTGSRRFNLNSVNFNFDHMFKQSFLAIRNNLVPVIPAEPSPHQSTSRFCSSWTC